MFTVSPRLRVLPGTQESFKNDLLDEALDAGGYLRGYCKGPSRVTSSSDEDSCSRERQKWV